MLILFLSYFVWLFQVDFLYLYLQFAHNFLKCFIFLIYVYLIWLNPWNYAKSYYILLFLFSNLLISGVIWSSFNELWLFWWFFEDIEELMIVFLLIYYILNLHFFTNFKLNVFNSLIFFYIIYIFLKIIKFFLFYLSKHLLIVFYNYIFFFYIYNYFLVIYPYCLLNTSTPCFKKMVYNFRYWYYINIGGFFGLIFYNYTFQFYEFYFFFLIQFYTFSVFSLGTYFWIFLLFLLTNFFTIFFLLLYLKRIIFFSHFLLIYLVLTLIVYFRLA